MKAFYLIDKPVGISSFDIIRILRKKLNTKKIGHTGTLDPLASGAVLLAVGSYTKLIPYLEKDTKEYEFELMLDGTTDSFDLAEEVIYIEKEKQKYYKKNIDLEKIKSLLEHKFSGEIEQIPPKYSALKINGQRAYKLARQGKQVDIKPRKVTIYNIEVLSYKYPKLSLKAKVSAGTYIRSIASDLGEVLGSGAYITKLRRTKIGQLDLKTAQGLDDFDAQKTLDVKTIFSKNKFISLDDKVLNKLDNGLSVCLKLDSLKEKEDAFVFRDGFITNIVSYSKAKLKPQKRL